VAGRQFRLHRRATVLNPNPGPPAGGGPCPHRFRHQRAHLSVRLSLDCRPPMERSTPVVTKTLPARAWHLGDILVPAAGPARRITLHRLEGAPAHAVVQFAGITGQTRYPLEHTESIERS